ncbi:MAG: hypothetical protein OEW59_00130 [Gammaproteobacteria bacterium]|nr:hypothetical protein [Gammaproteobacteria bacterium]
MPLFEFLMILISVVIGLALGEVLTGAASLLRVRESVKFYWIHVLFQVGIFFALLQQWWEAWDLVNIAVINLWTAILLLFPSVVLFVIAHLLFPRPAENTDLEHYYFKQAPILWSLVVIGTVVGTFVLPFIEGEPVFHWSNMSGIPMIAICSALAVSGNRTLHSVFAPLIIVLVVLDTWLANPTISSV